MPPHPNSINCEKDLIKKGRNPSSVEKAMFYELRELVESMLVRWEAARCRSRASTTRWPFAIISARRCSRAFASAAFFCSRCAGVWLLRAGRYSTRRLEKNEEGIVCVWGGCLETWIEGIWWKMEIGTARCCCGGRIQD